MNPSMLGFLLGLGLGTITAGLAMGWRVRFWRRKSDYWMQRAVEAEGEGGVRISNLPVAGAVLERDVYPLAYVQRRFPRADQ